MGDIAINGTGATVGCRRGPEKQRISIAGRRPITNGAASGRGAGLATWAPDGSENVNARRPVVWRPVTVYGAILDEFGDELAIAPIAILACPGVDPHLPIKNEDASGRRDHRFLRCVPEASRIFGDR